MVPYTIMFVYFPAGVSLYWQHTNCLVKDIMRRQLWYSRAEPSCVSSFALRLHKYLELWYLNRHLLVMHCDVLNLYRWLFTRPESGCCAFISFCFCSSFSCSLSGVRPSCAQFPSQGKLERWHICFLWSESNVSKIQFFLHPDTVCHLMHPRMIKTALRRQL